MSSILLGLSDIACFTQDGSTEKSPVFPWIVIFVPCGSISNLSPSDNSETTDKVVGDARVCLDGLEFGELNQIPVGSELYDIFACPSPDAAVDPSGAGFQKIGIVELSISIIPNFSKIKIPVNKAASFPLLLCFLLLETAEYFSNINVEKANLKFQHV